MRWLVLLPVCVAVFAFRALPGLQYTGTDATEWILKADLTTRAGWHYVFAEPHLVSYRPLTALSYGLDRLVSGLDPAGFHRTDLVLHCLNVVLAYAVASLLMGPALGVAAALVLAVHPLTTEVVPVLARRGDLLVTLFSLGAVWLALRRRPALAGLCTALAFACKDVAIVLPPVLMLAAFVATPDLDARARKRMALVAGGSSGLCLALLVVCRLLVTGRLGGYPDSPLRPGPLVVVGGFFSSLLAPTFGLFLPVGREAEARSVLIVLLIACLAAGALAGSRLARARRGAFLIGSSWLCLQLLLWIASRVFAPRLMYPSLLPFALFVLAPLKAPRFGLPWSALPLAALLLAMATGPLTRGLPEWQAAGKYQRAVMQSLERGLSEEPEQVVLVVNYPWWCRFDPAQRSTNFRGLPVHKDWDQTDILSSSALWHWVAAHKNLPDQPARIYPLNCVVFDAPDVVIPMAWQRQGNRVRIEIGPGPFRSYRLPVLLERGEELDTPNQSFTVTRQELRIRKRAGRLFLFNGREGEFIDLPEEIELVFKTQ